MAINEDIGREMMELFCTRLKEKLSDPEVTASELEVCRKVFESNSITINSIKRGDFGRVAQEVAEAFPFDNPVRLVAAQ